MCGAGGVAREHPHFVHSTHSAKSVRILKSSQRAMRPRLLKLYKTSARVCTCGTCEEFGKGATSMSCLSRWNQSHFARLQHLFPGTRQASVEFPGGAATQLETTPPPNSEEVAASMSGGTRRAQYLN